MKKIFVLSLLCLTYIACDPGKDIPAMEVPSVVVNSLKAEFSNASDLDWEIFGNNYKAEFEVNAIDHKALISAKGTLLESKYEINITDLPQVVIQSIKQNYPDEMVDEAHVLKIEDNTYYEVEFEGWIRNQHKVFTSEGTENKNIEHWD